MKIRWMGFLVTAAVFIVTSWSLWANGLNMGLDFTGGVQIEASRSTPFDPAEVRREVTAAGFEESSVTTSDGNRVIIKVPLEDGSTVEEIAGRLEKALGEGATILKTDNVSGKVSEELFGKGVMAAVLAVVGIGLYVWIRFEFKFGTGAFITTFHDVYAVIGFFSLTQMTFDLTIVAGVLTVAGYSINDTVVVYDRIREMLKKFKKLPIDQVIDVAITATLPRTIMTSFATLLAAGAMAVLGGQVLYGFAVSIIFGIFVGTYSSIFVAAPLLIHLPGKIPGAKYRGQEGGQEAAT